MSGAELAVLSVIAGGASAIATINAGKAQADQYNAQAKQAEIQGRVDALAYKQQGVTALQNLEKVLAANVARASAGNLDPLASGSSPDLIARLNTRDGVNEFTIARDNATMAEKMSKYQAANLRAAAVSVKRTSRLQAIASFGKSVASAGQIYPTPGFTGSATTAPTPSRVT